MSTRFGGIVWEVCGDNWGDLWGVSFEEFCGDIWGIFCGEFWGYIGGVICGEIFGDFYGEIDGAARLGRCRFRRDVWGDGWVGFSDIGCLVAKEKTISSNTMLWAMYMRFVEESRHL